MKTLIVYSQTQLGWDPAVPLMLGALRASGGVTDEAFTFDADCYDGMPSHLIETEFDAVICLDALSWFFQNRTLLLGRPWVCIIAFSMKDVMELSHSISRSLELGIHAIFTSSRNFVNDTSAIHPAVFARRPSSIWEWQKPNANRDWISTFGCVLPNIEDRDFSLLVYVAEHLKDTPTALNIYTNENDRQELPDVLKPYSVRVTNLFDAYSNFKYYVPAPRIIDYRIGHPPFEILEAIERGCLPLLVRHPLMNMLHELVSPQFSSLNELDTAIEQAKLETLVVEVNSARKYMSRPADLRAQVWQAYERWRANNAVAH